MISGVENFSNAKYLELQSKLNEVGDKQGFLGNAWNGFKEFSGLGKSESDCESMLEKYKNGAINFEEALAYIEDFEKKQDNSVDLITNIATGVGAIAYMGAGTFAFPAAFAAAPIGAAIKTAVNVLDRSTNKVEGDALDAKEIAKDVVSGAVTGTTSAVSSGIFEGVKQGNIFTSVKNGVKCGVACGAMSGSTSYLTDVALDKDKDFDAGDLIGNTATSALVSGVVGGTIGGGVYANVTKGGVLNNIDGVTRDSVLSSGRKIGGNFVRQTGNFFQKLAS